MPRPAAALQREIQVIRTSFHQIASSFSRLAPYLAALPDNNGDKTGRRRPRLTNRQRAALKLQGKYMGTMRGLKPREQSQVKKIRVTRGIEAAIKAAERLIAK